MSDKLVLVLNSGSSSLKFAIVNPINGDKPLFGSAENFFLSNACLQWNFNQNTHKDKLKLGISHQELLDIIINNIIKKTNLLQDITAIGHRIVHGGSQLTHSVLINEDVVQKIKNASIFAPLHNPAHLIAINYVIQYLPDFANKNVAVFDTSFHQTMPESSFLYAIPYKLYKQNGIRRYGAHGISHYYVSREAARILGKSLHDLNAITCHLGNGCSITAIRNGVCVDTSMGLTPLEGLVMGTRSGDIDPAIVFFLYEQLGMSITKINKLLTKYSGLLGITEITSDCKYLEKHYTCKKEVKRGLDIFCHRLAKYIASYSALMEERLDAMVFTGGIGENASLIRELSVNKLSLLNFQIDSNRNREIRFGKSGYINIKGTRPILVIPTNEELVIAQDTARLTN
ncbi:acetate kinase [Candidatus Ishikawella capsulata]|nr:acetate kinase [Candidatus Ishikawaella capsulata]